MEESMQYLCLCYQEEAALVALPGCDHDAIADEFLARREALRRGGHHPASAMLPPTSTATTVRVRGGRVAVGDGGCAGGRETLGGLVLIEARDLNEAIRL